MTDTLCAPALFALGGEATAADGYVLRRGKIFEAGAYADKDFTATPEDLYLAALDFAPVPNDIEHRASILDGQLGELRAVELSDDGGALIGTVAIPHWLNDAVGGAPLKASLAWDRETMRIVKNALVVSPRVPDAALFAAFAADFAGRRHNADDQRTLDELHDRVAAMDPALCGDGDGDDDGDRAAFAGARISAADRGRLRQVHDGLTALGAACPGEKGQAQMTATTISEQEQAQAVSVWQAIKSVFTGSDPAAPKSGATTAPVATFSAQDDPAVIALKAEVATLKADKVRMLATAFAEEFIGQHRALPAERESMMALFSQAHADDEAHPAVIFFGKNEDGTDRTGSRVAALRATYAAKSPHLLTEELLRDSPALAEEELRVVLMAAGTAPTDATRPTPEGKQPSAERVAHLKAMIPGTA